MKCLSEFTKWNASINLHAVVHQSEVWSASWDSCEKYYAPYVASLESRIAALEAANKKLARHNDELILDLHLQDAHKNANANT